MKPYETVPIPIETLKLAIRSIKQSTIYMNALAKSLKDDGARKSLLASCRANVALAQLLMKCLPP